MLNCTEYWANWRQYLHAAITHRQDMKYRAIQRLEIIEAGEFSMQNLGQFNVQLNTASSDTSIKNPLVTYIEVQNGSR